MLLLRQAGLGVTFVAEDNFVEMPGYTAALQRAGIEVLYRPYCTSVEAHLEKYGARYDLALLFRPSVAERQFPLVRKYCPSARVIYHTSDLHFLRMDREADLEQDGDKRIAAAEMRTRELRAIQQSNATIVHSSAEQKILLDLLPRSNVWVFQWAIRIRGTEREFRARRDIAFVGGYQHPPNLDAVKYFLKDIFPLVRKQIPGVRFIAVGSHAPAELLALASDDVLVPGFVEDLASLLDGVRVAVAPLRFGAGIKGKIGTTLSVGLPSVATTVAAEGMGLQDGQNVLIADSPNEFAAAIFRLYSDESIWRHISICGLEFANQTYGYEAAERLTRGILESVGIPASKAPFVHHLVSPLGPGAPESPIQSTERKI